MSEKFNSILAEIPENLYNLIKSLKNEFRLRLIGLLIKNGALSLSAIKRLMEKENGYILSHIKIMEIHGAIQNFMQRKDGMREYSFYKSTDIINLILEDLINKYYKFYGACKTFSISGGDAMDDDVFNDLLKIFKALSNKTRFAIVLLLLDRGALSFSAIVRATGRSKNSVSKHLKMLELCGFIQNFFKKEVDSNEYSFYELTKFGRALITQIIESYNRYYSWKESNISG
ncbi:MAG: ArsR/SmtB family transcription factor [Promethearchaeota archaeon]